MEDCLDELVLEDLEESVCGGTLSFYEMISTLDLVIDGALKMKYFPVFVSYIGKSRQTLSA